MIKPNRRGLRLSVMVLLLCEGLLGHQGYRQRGRIERVRHGAAEHACRWCGRHLLTSWWSR